MYHLPTCIYLYQEQLNCRTFIFILCFSFTADFYIPRCLTFVTKKAWLDATNLSTDSALNEKTVGMMTCITEETGFSCKCVIFCANFQIHNFHDNLQGNVCPNSLHIHKFILSENITESAFHKKKTEDTKIKYFTVYTIFFLLTILTD